MSRLWLLLALAAHCLACAAAEKNAAPAEVRYVAVGDSYTIGEGAKPDEAWPSLLTKHLAEAGLNIRLAANPARTGWTAQDAIERELPAYRAARPTFATLQIGVNDWVRQVDAKTLRARLVVLLDRMLAELPDKKRLLVVTIPDFSVTPAGAIYGGGRDIATGLAEFNGIIRDEARKRDLSVVDVFPLSQGMGRDPELVAPDGLHPSAKEYALWEKLIFPVALGLLQKK